MAEEGENVTQEIEFVGHDEAAGYIGIDTKTLSGYTARGTGPRIDRKEIVGHYVKSIFKKSDVDHWMKNRPGQGARTDLIKVGSAGPTTAAQDEG